MNYLADTHILLWSMLDSQKLSKTVLGLFENKEQKDSFYFSQISLYEIAIKQKIGKLPEAKSGVITIYEQLLQDGYNFLSIKNEHIASYAQIPLQENHRDPFDRLLLATAYQEKMTIITADEKFKLYQDFVKILING